MRFLCIDLKYVIETPTIFPGLL